MCSEEKVRIVVNTRSLRSRGEFYLIDRFVKTLFDISLDRLFEILNAEIICLDESCKHLFMIERSLLDKIRTLRERDVEVVSAGLRIGFIESGKFIPTPLFLDLLYERLATTRGAVIAGERGVKAFLYGNDLLYESVIKIYEPFKRNHIVSIIDPEDGRVVGIGVATEDLEEILKWPRTREYMIKPVVKNIFDLGFYLRAQREEEYE
ncbi:MAG: PUA domain-containing protein [Sulfolobales archaeon]